MHNGTILTGAYNPITTQSGDVGAYNLVVIVLSSSNFKPPKSPIWVTIEVLVGLHIYAMTFAGCWAAPCPAASHCSHPAKNGSLKGICDAKHPHVSDMAWHRITQRNCKLQRDSFPATMHLQGFWELNVCSSHLWSAGGRLPS